MDKDKRKNFAAQAAIKGLSNRKPPYKKAGSLQPAAFSVCDEEPELFVKIPKAMFSMGLSPVQKAVYVSLKFYANGTERESEVYPSLNTLANNAGITRPTVISAIKHLESLGMVQVEKVKEGGAYKSNRYRLIASYKWGGSKTILPGVVKEIDQGSKTILPKQELGYQDSDYQEPTPSSNLGLDGNLSTSDEEDDTPLDPKSMLTTFLDQHAFKPEEQQQVELFCQIHNLDRMKLYSTIFDVIARGGCHKDGLLYAMTKTTMEGPEKPISYLYRVALDNKRGGPLNDPTPKDTTGQHIPTSQLPDAEKIKDKQWDYNDLPGGIYFLTRKAFDLKDTESNKIWFGDIVRELKDLRRRSKLRVSVDVVTDPVRKD